MRKSQAELDTVSQQRLGYGVTMFTLCFMLHLLLLSRIYAIAGVKKIKKSTNKSI